MYFKSSPLRSLLHKGELVVGECLITPDHSSPFRRKKKKDILSDVPFFLVREAGFVCIFFLLWQKENKCSHQFLNWWQQYATGILHLEHSSPFRTKKKKDIQSDVLFFLVREAGFVCIFFLLWQKENKCSHQFLNWWQQYATGILHLHHSSPTP